MCAQPRPASLSPPSHPISACSSSRRLRGGADAAEPHARNNRSRWRPRSRWWPRSSGLPRAAACRRCGEERRCRTRWTNVDLSTKRRHAAAAAGPEPTRVFSRAE